MISWKETSVLRVSYQQTNFVIRLQISEHIRIACVIIFLPIFIKKVHASILLKRVMCLFIVLCSYRELWSVMVATDNDHKN